MSKCVICGKDVDSEVYTAGDGFNDGQYVGIPREEFKFYCWDHYHQAPDHEW